ncbi:MAG: TonB-dependent receptor, partial [Hyphomicrobium sp.]
FSATMRIATSVVALMAVATATLAQEQTPPADAPPAAAAPAADAPAPTTPPPATTTAPSTAAPADGSATTAPAAADAPPPAADAPASGQAAQPAPPASGQQLPEVEVIQTQPEKTPPAPEADAPPRVVKRKPAPVAPQPVAVKPKPKPKPVQQAAPEPQPDVQPVAEVEQQPEGPVETSGPPAGDTPVRVSPIAGSELPLDKVPTSVGRASATEIAAEGSGQVQQALQQQVPGVIVSDIGGSGFRTDVSYRGFDSSPVGGRAQGLAVYQNGIRINESFGDSMNWDIIPSNAIQDITVISSNPVFGLNAVGGAISIVTKDGFTYEGGEIDVMGGSFGRRQIGVQAGGNSGAFGAYIAAEGLKEDGFRDFSEAEVKRMFGDIGVKGDGVEVHFNLTAAKTTAGVVAAAPVDLLRRDWGRTFTSPQETDIEVLMPSVSASVKATETLTFSGVGYYRKLTQRVVDGNLSETDECVGGPGADFLCLTEDGVEEAVRDVNGTLVLAPDGPIGSIERINTDADSFGGSLQAVEKSRLFNRPNQFLVGVSYDHGKVGYTTSSEVGEIGPRFVVTGTGTIVVEPDDLAPRNLETENDYYGIYFSNALDITDEFTLTVGGRYNHATIQLTDLTGDFPELNTTNKYERFNPTVGGTYRLMPGLSVYGSYSEANRAPTAAELGCAEPENPCFIESFLTDDPPLKQVISKSYEAGLRGESKSYDNQKFTWSIGYFRTLNTDDIVNVAATSTGRGYFLNAGDTLRQGVELAAGYKTDRLSVYGSYTYVDATYRDNLILPAPNTPGADECPVAGGDDEGAEGGVAEEEEALCNFVQASDSLPGIPKHRFKAGIAYWLTPQWKIGTDLVSASDQFFFGDDANNRAPLAGYTRVDLNTTYDLNDNVQIYGLVKNAFDRRYGLYGTFFAADEANGASEATGVTFSGDARSITPAAPFAAYGGVRIKF